MLLWRRFPALGKKQIKLSCRFTVGTWTDPRVTPTCKSPGSAQSSETPSPSGSKCPCPRVGPRRSCCPSPTALGPSLDPPSAAADPQVPPPENTAAEAQAAAPDPPDPRIRTGGLTLWLNMSVSCRRVVYWRRCCWIHSIRSTSSFSSS